MPKEYRDAIRLEPGAPVAVLRIGDALILMPEQARFNTLCDSISSALEGLNISEADLQERLPKPAAALGLPGAAPPARWRADNLRGQSHRRYRSKWRHSTGG